MNRNSKLTSNEEIKNKSTSAYEKDDSQGQKSYSLSLSVKGYSPSQKNKIEPFSPEDNLRSGMYDIH